MIPVQMADMASGNHITSRKIWQPPLAIDLEDRPLLVADPASVYGSWKTASRTSSGTTQLIGSKLSTTSIMITDLVITGDKKNAATCEVRITDGTNDETLFLLDMSDAPVALSIQFKGRIQTWAGAHIDMITTSTATITCMAGYIHIPDALTYEVWDALR
jgi:hypothetical protein